MLEKNLNTQVHWVKYVQYGGEKTSLIDREILSSLPTFTLKYIVSRLIVIYNTVNWYQCIATNLYNLRLFVPVNIARREN